MIGSANRFTRKSSFAVRLGSTAARAAVSAVGITVFVFLVLRLVPGDPVDLMLGEGTAATSRIRLRAELGLDQPLSAQLRHFVLSTIHGDLGQSLAFHKPVTKLIAETMPYTLSLALAAMVLANLCGVPLGAFLAYRPQKKRAIGIFFISIVAVSIPVFWLGPILVMAFSLHWPWLPFSSAAIAKAGLPAIIKAAILPLLATTLGLSAHLLQTSRAAVAEVLHTDFIRTAHAKGLSHARVLFRHALPAAAAPIITVSALQLGHLLAGAIVTEMLFDWPGLGKLLYDAIIRRDYPTVQGATFLVALSYIVINSLADLATKREGT